MPVHLAFALRGTLVWAVSTLVLRLLPEAWVDRPAADFAVVAAVTGAGLVAATLWIGRRLAAPARPAAVAAFVAPQMVGDALIVAFFPVVLPNFPAGHAAVFGAVVIWCYAVMLATALMAGRETNDGAEGHPL